jgi:hypothetical protein
MIIPESNRSLGVLTVATNIYIDYWREMAISLDNQVQLSDNVVLHVFTNQTEEVDRIRTELNNVVVVTHEIPNFKWPEATLLRYKIFHEASNDISEEILMHLDADMLVNLSPLETIFNASSVSPICLVSHPGYWRPKGFVKKANFYWKNLSVLLNDVRMMLVLGGLGSWETNNKSTAFVQRRYRRSYVCGGTWFGDRKSFFKLVRELSQNVAVDLEQNRIAVWHDESHLNTWAAQNAHLILDPELCYVGAYPQLKGLIATITAVDKTISTR